MMVENPFEEHMLDSRFDQSLTQRGMEMAEDLKMHIMSTIEGIADAPLADRPADDLGALWGEVDEDKIAVIDFLKNMSRYLEIAVLDSARRQSEKNIFGIKNGLKSRCSRRKLGPINVQYNPMRKANRAESDLLHQMLGYLEDEDVVNNIRSCSSYFDAACEQFKMVVERFV